MSAMNSVSSGCVGFMIVLFLTGLSVLYITVKDFRIQAAEKQVSMVIVHKSTEGYAIALRLAWRNEEHLLVEARKQKVRIWLSLDRLLAFLEREEINVPELVVKFNS